MEELPLTLLNMAISDGQDLDFRPRELEELVLDIADTHRFGGGWTQIEREIQETTKYNLIATPEGELPYRFADEEEEVEGTEGLLLFGPAAVGGFVRFLLHRSGREPGPSVAPTVVVVFRFTDALFDTRLGELLPAEDRSDSSRSTAPSAKKVQ